MTSNSSFFLLCCLLLIGSYQSYLLKNGLLQRPLVIARNAENEEKAEGSNKRPPIMPFDFARDDIKLPPSSTQNSDPKKILEENLKKLRKEQALKEVQQAIANRDNARPAGYDNPDEDDEEERTGPLRIPELFEPLANIDMNSNSTDSPVVKFLKDVYIDSPTDSRRRKQARYVIRNVTLISIIFGAVFTALWYLAPGKFISYKGDTDFSTRYTVDYMDPSNLLNMQSDGTEGEYFDNADGLPEKEETRVPYPKSEGGELIKSRQLEL